MTSSLPADAGDLHVSVDDSIATVWLNRPAKRNAVTYDMWLDIADTCERLANDDTVRVLVLRGVGEHFCAGADIAGLGDTNPADYQTANHAADHALATFPKPTIAFITGACVGGGTELAIACDLRLADTTARFGITPARLGIIYPATALERAVALIGPAAAKHLLYTADIIDIARAHHIGLVDEVLPREDAGGRLAELTGRLAHERSLLTQQATKQMIADIGDHGSVQPGTQRHWAEQLTRSPDPAEGITAFLARRAPHFTSVPSPEASD